MNIEIIKEKRKSIILKVLSCEKAVLKVPLHISDKRVNEFIKSKTRWLDRVARKMEEKQEFSCSFDFNNFIYLHGKKIDRKNNLIEHFDEMSEAQKSKAIKEFYLSHFDYLINLTKEISEGSNLKYKDIKPLNSVRIWGSYNVNGCIKLNWKLLVLPENLVKYVICHELCHSKYMNHKPIFWREVQRICPNCKELRKELENYSFLLNSNL